MKARFRQLRIAQLERTLKPFFATKEIPVPPKGWIRAIREATGITVRDLARRLDRAPSVAMRLERSEAESRITLASLRSAADAMGCRLVYALVPKGESFQELLETNARTRAADIVKAVEHSMALEDQAVGGIAEKIAEETKRLLRRR